MLRFACVALFAVACGGSESTKTPAGGTPAPAAKVPTAQPPAAVAPEVSAPNPAAVDGEPELATATVEQGKVVYDTYCAACHQSDGAGMNGTMATDFTKDKTRLAQSDDALRAIIKEGSSGKIGTMPGWKQTLQDQQVRSVLMYMKATFGQ